MVGLIGAIKGKRNADVPMRTLVNHLVIAMLPVDGGRAARWARSIFSMTAPDDGGYRRVCRKWASCGRRIAGSAIADNGGLQEPEGSRRAAGTSGRTRTEGAGRCRCRGRKPQGRLPK